MRKLRFWKLNSGIEILKSYSKMEHFKINKQNNNNNENDNN